MIRLVNIFMHPRSRRARPSLRDSSFDSRVRQVLYGTDTAVTGMCLTTRRPADVSSVGGLGAGTHDADGRPIAYRLSGLRPPLRAARSTSSVCRGRVDVEPSSVEPERGAGRRRGTHHATARSSGATRSEVTPSRVPERRGSTKQKHTLSRAHRTRNRRRVPEYSRTHPALYRITTDVRGPCIASLSVVERGPRQMAQHPPAPGTSRPPWGTPRSLSARTQLARPAAARATARACRLHAWRARCGRRTNPPRATPSMRARGRSRC
eukprot:3870437-Prymnesium_polylepis.1